MNDKKFIISFVVTLIITGVVLLVCYRSGTMSNYVDIGVYSSAVFSILSIVVYLLTKAMSQIKKKVIFIQLIMLNMLTKMTLSAVIVYIYFIKKAPDDGVFIIPFLVVYVIFTIFETYFMNEQAKAK